MCSNLFPKGAKNESSSLLSALEVMATLHGGSPGHLVLMQDKAAALTRGHGLLVGSGHAMLCHTLFAGYLLRILWP